ncbi:phosphotransferase family protein [Gordonia polyisoprenivorans]|uniref:phosphotransferase family protein n=1 Tax=Gordonia polyisoprenivorans TaxID=84595 RepID=UPI001AD62485|nr:phosphotransferase family protein [Gordonia polyisoprenivorans]QTI70919.1 phosphotransferase family protein [Gordonia polyisoprenivorans]
MESTASAEAFDLTAWLAGELGMLPPVRIEQMAGGWSNITSFGIDAEGQRVVVRQPPAQQAGGDTHDVVREARICAALRDTAVPAPGAIAVCDHRAVAPQPFSVMAPAPGEVVESVAIATSVGPAHQADLGFDLIDLLADLQAVDLDVVGLGDLRRSTPYLARQLRRWRAEWVATGDPALTATEHVANQRRERAGDFEVVDVLVHRDFRFGNAMIVSGAIGEPRDGAAWHRRCVRILEELSAELVG